MGRLGRPEILPAKMRKEGFASAADNGFRPQRAVGVYLFVYLFDFHDTRMLDWQGFQGIIR